MYCDRGLFEEKQLDIYGEKKLIGEKLYWRNNN